VKVREETEMTKNRIIKIACALAAVASLASCSSELTDLQNLQEKANSSAKSLLTFGFTTSTNTALAADATGTIDQSAHTVAVDVPYGTDVTALVATFTCSDGASVTVGSTAQTSGTTVNNFTNAVTYTVTAEDGSTQTYAVTVCGVQSDAICETKTVIAAGTDGTAGTSGTYVYFGSWPQTIKASGVTVDTSTTKTMGAATYYLGSDGYWYAKVTAAPYGSGYTFTNGTAVTSGTEYYFKVEPIKWRVLESGKLLAESVLANVAYYPYYNVNRTIGSKTVYPNNYQYSRIRAYLNGLSYTEEKSSDTSAPDGQHSVQRQGLPADCVHGQSAGVYYGNGSRQQRSEHD
jgi:hypothetical protein